MWIARGHIDRKRCDLMYTDLILASSITCRGGPTPQWASHPFLVIVHQQPHVGSCLKDEYRKNVLYTEPVRKPELHSIANHTKYRVYPPAIPLFGVSAEYFLLHCNRRMILNISER